MTIENPFLNNNKEQEAPVEAKRTKKEAQQELIEKFNIRKTSDFQSALQEGGFELAEEWLDYIVENRESFPQYEKTWDNWLNDRQGDIEFYKKLKEDGLLEKMEHRTKEELKRGMNPQSGHLRKPAMLTRGERAWRTRTHIS